MKCILYQKLFNVLVIIEALNVWSLTAQHLTRELCFQAKPEVFWSELISSSTLKCIPLELFLFYHCSFVSYETHSVSHTRNEHTIWRRDGKSILQQPEMCIDFIAMQALRILLDGIFF